MTQISRKAWMKKATSYPGGVRCAVHPDGVAEVVTQPVGEAPAARRCPTAAKRIDVYRTLAGATRVSSSMGLMCTGTGLRSAGG